MLPRKTAAPAAATPLLRDDEFHFRAGETHEGLRPLFDRYATAASLMTADNASAAGDMRAFISPLRYKKKMYLYGVNTEI